MISFSVNSGVDTADKAKKVAKLIKDMNEYNQEYLSDAYIQLVTGTKDKKVNLNDYASRCQKADNRKNILKYEKEEQNLISIEELENGSFGVCEDDVIDPIDYEMLGIDEADTSYYVETFLNIRQFIFFKDGHDIWRLFTLARRGDKQAATKIRMISDKFSIVDFMMEFCSHYNYILAVQKFLG